MKNEKLKNILKSVLKSEDCVACKSCCKFGKKDYVDAPTFTEDQKKELLIKNDKLLFERVGGLWKIKLDSMEDSGEERYVCPLYGLSDHNCAIYNNRPFDCFTWPFYVMNVNSRIVITVSKDCPVILNKKLDYLIDFASSSFLPAVLDSVKKYPDLIVPYHDNVVVLLDVSRYFKK